MLSVKGSTRSRQIIRSRRKTRRRHTRRLRQMNKKRSRHSNLRSYRWSRQGAEQKEAQDQSEK